MKKIMMIFLKKCPIEMYENARFTCNFFQFKYFLNYFYNFSVDFGKNVKMNLKYSIWT
jgi:hypothetical protein